jgi:hypothetical protein
MRQAPAPLAAGLLAPVRRELEALSSAISASAQQTSPSSSVPGTHPHSSRHDSSGSPPTTPHTRMLVSTASTGRPRKARLEGVPSPRPGTPCSFLRRGRTGVLWLHRKAPAGFLGREAGPYKAGGAVCSTSKSTRGFGRKRGWRVWRSSGIETRSPPRAAHSVDQLGRLTLKEASIDPRPS